MPNHQSRWNHRNYEPPTGYEYDPEPTIAEYDEAEGLTRMVRCWHCNKNITETEAVAAWTSLDDLTEPAGLASEAAVDYFGLVHLTKIPPDQLVMLPEAEGLGEIETVAICQADMSELIETGRVS